MSSSTIRVKICGLTAPDDGQMAAAAGADAVGLNFVGGPRRIDGQTAAEILGRLPQSIEVWALADVSHGALPALLQDLIAQQGSDIGNRARITHVQMYGPVQPNVLELIQAQGLRTVAVRHVADDTFARQTGDWLRRCGKVRPDLILLDAAASSHSGDPATLGGTGRTLNWAMIAAKRQAGELNGWPPLVLAGGLRPENVADAIRTVHPDWVDVSSGVEQRPGRKDRAKVEAFVRNAKTAHD